MRKFRLGFVVGLLFIVVSMNAQDINSPFSRFGLGRLYGKNVSAQLQSMGGISLGIANPYIINMANPASYAAFDSLTFVFQTGIFGSLTTLRNTITSDQSNYATMSQMVMGFPVTRWWRSSMGVTPYSKVGYNTRIAIPVSGFGPMVSDRWGKGGITQAYWGNGFNLSHNLRVGVNLTYLFGNTRFYNMVYSADSLNVFGTKNEQYLRVGDFIYDWGVQYDIHLKKNRKIILGLVYSNRVNVTAYRSVLTTTITGGYGTNVGVVRDTIRYVPDEKGSVLIPAHYGIGFTYSQLGQWLIGADVKWQDWSKFKSFGQAGYLQNTFSVAIGGEFTPKHNTISSLGKRMTYRFGAYFNQTYLNMYGHSINEYAITGGIRFPFKRTRSNLNLGIALGSRGTLQNNLIKESFFSLSFGINIVENWFYKRKYR